MPAETTEIGVYAAINKVQAALAKTGITKDRKNLQQNYSFRGIDEVYNALSPLLAENALCILPRILSRSQEVKETKQGGSLNYVTVEAEFDFVCASDGSRHTIRTFGEAMDSADKATNKAMSAAYKYAAFMVFAIPTQGENDADYHTHEAQPARRQTPQRPPAQAADQDGRAPGNGYSPPARNGQPQSAQAEPECSACGHPILPATANLSTRKFGVALCPTCQKDHQEVAA